LKFPIRLNKIDGAQYLDLKLNFKAQIVTNSGSVFQNLETEDEIYPPYRNEEPIYEFSEHNIEPKRQKYSYPYKNGQKINKRKHSSLNLRETQLTSEPKQNHLNDGEHEIVQKQGSNVHE
jgi:hypothetical protein